MAKKEKFGKFVLLEEIEASGLGHEYRAAKLGASGLEKIVSILRIKSALSSHPEVVRGLMDQVKFAAQLQNPNILKIYGIGKVETAYYISYEFTEGKSLNAIFGRCRQEGFPFSIDHALLIASKICSALEYAHSRKTESGARYFHGMVNPSNVFVSYEGEVRSRGFGYWPGHVREAGGMSDDEALYLAPEQAASGAGDTRSDAFAIGALLFEMLTGQALFQSGRQIDIKARIDRAKLQNPTTDDDALPKPIRDILHKALAADPAARYGEIQEMRKGVDTLLFSGDFTPTTFNLAFFMHSLFREDIERESKTLKEEKEAPYTEYLTEDVRTSKSGAFPAVTAAAAAAAVAPAAPAPSLGEMERIDRHTPTPVPVPVPATVHAEPVVAHATPPHAHHTPPPVSHGTSHAPHAPAAHGHGHADAALSSREAAAGFTFHKEEKAPKSKAPLLGGIAALVLVAGAAAFFLKDRFAGPPPPPPTTTLSAEAVAAMQRVKELEERLKSLEEEKAAAAAAAEEEARLKLEAQAKAKGQQVDPAAVARAQEAARLKAQQEQERKAAEEQRRLEAERLAAEAQILEERRKADEAARLAAAATLPPTTVATPPPTTAPPAPTVRVGQLVEISEPGVIAPIALHKATLQYPQIALRQRIEGKVDLSVLVDERGNVADAKVLSAAGGKAGLNEAAVDSVRRWKFRPASKEGVNVKTWVPVSVNFVLPR
jgi:TonB family protein